jgi:uncharacterized protein YuzE
MKVNYDKDANAMTIVFSTTPVVESEELRPGVIFDFDVDGHIVAIEFLDAREQLASNTIADLQAAE